MQYEVPLSMSVNHDMSTAGHYAQQNLYVPNGNNRIKTENGSDRGVSPHASEHSSRYSSQTPQSAVNYHNLAAQLNGMRYPSPSQLQQQHPMPMMPHSYHPNPQHDHSSYPPQTAPLGGSVPPAVQSEPSPMDGGRASTGSSSLPKAFSCSTCSKGFARRSDLARHERIHSGVRPHVCDHPGCGKQFIQRSALTVHSRVHTGEKPHMCERCGKPFSDSSSLARHRRIHSGKRPYKCPYANCQKTFTRRTTLTRHQNHHTGTIEESEAATAAVLAAREPYQQLHRARPGEEDSEYTADGKSPMPQVGDRNSVSPATNSMGAMPPVMRQPSDYYMNAMNGGMAAVPPHLRPEMQPSRPQSPAQYSMPAGAPAPRPSLTSNPAAGYNPPHILEPPTSNGQQQPNSGNNSPHMSATMGWQSPHNGITAGQQAEYSYPDPNGGYNVNPPQMYYQAQHVSRPQSTGPVEYHNQLRSQELWTPHQA